jgi:hypothetical protein
MTQSLTAPQVLQAPTWSLAVAVRLAEDGPEAAREAVTERDLADAYSESWLQCCLRKGHPDIPFEDFRPRLVPLFRETGAPFCTGFALEATTPTGEAARCEFTVHGVGSTAVRAVQRLIASGSMKASDTYYYELLANRRPMLPPTRRGEAPAVEAISVTARNPTLTYLDVLLPPLLRQARTVGAVDERSYHVFYTEEALARAERCARKGARSQPPIETGAVLIGPLCSCPETGEFFLVVSDALEVHDAEGTEFTLTYSGQSWARIQAVLRARQARPATRAQRLAGQCHGHNFLPGGGAPPCAACHQVQECSRTSVFVSLQDRTWSRAVFSRQPWQLCHLFGLNARGEQVQCLYGLRDGRLLERGYHVLPEFRPKA